MDPFRVDPEHGYRGGGSWREIPGGDARQWRQLAVSETGRVYGIGADNGNVYGYFWTAPEGAPTQRDPEWESWDWFGPLGGPAEAIFAALDTVLAIEAGTGHLYVYELGGVAGLT